MHPDGAIREKTDFIRLPFVILKNAWYDVHMKYTTYHSENYYPVRRDGALVIFYRNLCFSWQEGSDPVLLYADFGPPEVTALPDLPPGFYTTLDAVAAENQGDPIGAMLIVCATRSFPAEDHAAVTHWAQSVNMMIRSLTHGGAAYSEAGFTLTNLNGENTSVHLTDILESHCLPSGQTYQEEDTAMGTSENNADVLSMEELLKIAEEAAPADAPMDDPVLAEAVAGMPASEEPVAEEPVPEVGTESPVDIPETAVEVPAEEPVPEMGTESPVDIPEAAAEIPAEPIADSSDAVTEADIAIKDEDVDMIVANMLGNNPVSEEIPPIDETAPLPEDIIPDIPLAEADPMAAEAPAFEEAVTEEPEAGMMAEAPQEPETGMVAEAPPEPASEMMPEIPEMPEEPVTAEPTTEDPAPAEDFVPAEEMPVPEADIAVPEEENTADAESFMEEPILPEEPPAFAEPAADTPLLTPMNDDPAHCVLCVRVDPAEVDLDIPENSTMMISDNTVIFPENGALLTQDLLTGAKDRSALNASVLAAFSISMEGFAAQNETYTLHSLLFSWLLKKLLVVSEDPSAAQKINNTLAFLGSPFRYTETGFTDGTGQTLTAAEVFYRLSAQKI